VVLLGKRNEPTYLAGILSGPDGEVESVMEVGDVLNEALRSDIIIVDSNAIKLRIVVYQDGWK
jgi:hypothetical protein